MPTNQSTSFESYSKKCAFYNKMYLLQLNTLPCHSKMVEFGNVVFQMHKTRVRGAILRTVVAQGENGAALEVAQKAGKAFLIALDDVDEVRCLKNFDGLIMRFRLQVNDTVSWIKVTLDSKEMDFKVHFAELQQFLDQHGKPFKILEPATKGTNVGSFAVNNSSLEFHIDDQFAFDVPMQNIRQTVIQSKNELAIEFVQDDVQAVTGEQLFEMRIWTPDVVAAESTEEEEEDDANRVNPAQRFERELLDSGAIRESISSKPIASLQVMFVTPRGQYSIDMYEKQLKLHNKTFSYLVPYSTISRTLLLDVNDPVSQQPVQTFFVISLNPPIRQGRTAYPYLVARFNKADQTSINVSSERSKLQTQFSHLLKEKMSGETWDIVSRIFKGVTDAKVIVPGSAFRGSTGGASVRCNLKASQGYLFLMEKSLVFVHKPPTFITHKNIQAAEFQRVTSSSLNNRTIDLKIISTDGAGKTIEHTFASIQREEYDNLQAYFQNKGIQVQVSMEEVSMAEHLVVDDDDLDGYSNRIADEGGDSDDSDEHDSDYAGSEDDTDEEEGDEEDMAPEVDEGAEGIIAKPPEKASKKKKKRENETPEERAARKAAKADRRARKAEKRARKAADGNTTNVDAPPTKKGKADPDSIKKDLDS